MLWKLLALFTCLALIHCDASAQPTSSARLAPVHAPLPIIPAASQPLPTSQPDVAAATLAVLKMGLESSDWMVRLSATQALHSIVHPTALPWLEARLGDVEADVRAAAVLVLASRTEQHAAALLRSVQDDTTEDLSIRVLAASALAASANPCQ
jgi:HEAT repeat protein